jgi:uncharacterized protein YndB with AHSA1/START domain
MLGRSWLGTTRRGWAHHPKRWRARSTYETSFDGNASASVKDRSRLLLTSTNRFVSRLHLNLINKSVNSELVNRELDFRVGGKEILHGELASGPVIFTARYHAIEPSGRIVYAFDMHVEDQHFSVSLASVEFVPTARGTRMLFTEQAAFLTGEDGLKSREAGTAAHFERLGSALDAGR